MKRVCFQAMIAVSPFCDTDQDQTSALGLTETGAHVHPSVRFKSCWEPTRGNIFAAVCVSLTNNHGGMTLTLSLCPAHLVSVNRAGQVICADSGQVVIQVVWQTSLQKTNNNKTQVKSQIPNTDSNGSQTDNPTQHTYGNVLS